LMLLSNAGANLGFRVRGRDILKPRTIKWYILFGIKIKLN